jgi:hypothetical protein
MAIGPEASSRLREVPPGLPLRGGEMAGQTRGEISRVSERQARRPAKNFFTAGAAVVPNYLGSRGTCGTG